MTNCQPSWDRSRYTRFFEISTLKRQPEQYQLIPRPPFFLDTTHICDQMVGDEAAFWGSVLSSEYLLAVPDFMH